MAPDPRRPPTVAATEEEATGDSAKPLAAPLLASSPNLPVVRRHNSPEAVARLEAMLPASFLLDPLLIAFTLERLGRLLPPYGYTAAFAPITEADLAAVFSVRMARKLQMAGAHIAEAGGFAAACLWEAPGAVDFPASTATLATTQPIVAAFQVRIAAARAHHLAVATDPATGEPVLHPFWHMSMMARDTDPRRLRLPGAVRAIVEPYLRAAEQAGVAVCMEAGNEHARDVYVHFGMEAVEEVRCGVGIVGADGYPVITGDGREAVGVPTYLMLFNGPRQQKRAA